MKKTTKPMSKIQLLALRANACLIKFLISTLRVITCAMHDLYLGVGRYAVAQIIKHCVKSGYFKLEQLNSRLSHFDSSATDRGTKISSISSEHVDEEYLKRATAAEMSFLISYFVILFGDLICEDELILD